MSTGQSNSKRKLVHMLRDRPFLTAWSAVFSTYSAVVLTVLAVRGIL